MNVAPTTRPTKTLRQWDRERKLLPNGEPKYVRCYDNGGKTADRYTVVYTGPYRRNGTLGEYLYLGMSSNPRSPQGFGQHGFSKEQIDRPQYSHIGKPVPFFSLPPHCRSLAIETYKDLWNLN